MSITAKKGFSPYISNNGNWFVYDQADEMFKDTGIVAINPQESGGQTVTQQGDYSELINLPQINGVTLLGNKTFSNLGLSLTTDSIRIPATGASTIPDSIATSPTQIGYLTLSAGIYIIRFAFQWVASDVEQPAFREIFISLNSATYDNPQYGNIIGEPGNKIGVVQQTTRILNLDTETTIYFFAGQHTGTSLQGVGKIDYLKIT